MSKSLTVAWREFKQTVFRPIFLLAIIAMPLVIGGAIVLSVVLAESYEQPPLVGAIAVVDETGELSDAAVKEFSKQERTKDQQRQLEQSLEQMQGGPGAMSPGNMSPGVGEMPQLQRGEVSIDIERFDPTADAFNQDDIRQRVRAGDLLAAAIIDSSLLDVPEPDEPRDAELQENGDDEETSGTAEATPPSTQSNTPKFQLFISPEVKTEHIELIEDRLGEAVVRVRTNRAGLDPDRAMAMLKRPRATTQRLLESGEETEETDITRAFKLMIPMAFMALIFIGVFTSGQHLLMSTIEEKSSRVMEVLLSAVSPMQLMTGKILGHGCVGLLLVAVYGSVAIAGIIAFSAMHFIELSSLVYLVIFFFMGYFMVASMFAAVGAAVTDIREANTLITPVMMLVWIPWILWFPISQDPNGVIGTVFSFVPPIMPFVMILRIGADEVVPMWQIIASIAWGTVCTVAMIWMAAKIFRIGVLMYGKPPTPLQLLKWLRYS